MDNPDAYLSDYPDGLPMSAEEVVEDLRARLAECETERDEAREASEDTYRLYREAWDKNGTLLAENERLKEDRDEWMLEALAARDKEPLLLKVAEAAKPIAQYAVSAHGVRAMHIPVDMLLRLFSALAELKGEG